MFSQDVRMASGPGLPDSLVLEIFLHLPHKAVLSAGFTCRQWFAVSRDEFLWKELFYSYYRIPRSVPRHPGTPAAPQLMYFFAKYSCTHLHICEDQLKWNVTVSKVCHFFTLFVMYECHTVAVQSKNAIPACVQRLCHGTGSSSGCMTASPVWRFRF